MQVDETRSKWLIVNPERKGGNQDFRTLKRCFRAGRLRPAGDGFSRIFPTSFSPLRPQEFSMEDTISWPT
jgi:hypothetical protein